MCDTISIILIIRENFAIFLTITWWLHLFSFQCSILLISSHFAFDFTSKILLNCLSQSISGRSVTELMSIEYAYRPNKLQDIYANIIYSLIEKRWKNKLQN